MASGACGAARCLAHMTASTSAPGCGTAPLRMRHTAAGRGRGRAAPARPLLPPARVTNTQKEIWGANERMKKLSQYIDPETATAVPVDDTPLWDPERGSLEQRVARTAVEEQATEEFSLLETAYWFHTPPDGWKVDQMVPVLKEVEGDFPQPRHDPQEVAEGYRCPLDHLQEGLEVEGIVTDIWLYHGAQVDFLGEFDGLIPIEQAQWDAVHEDLLPGKRVKVRIHALRDPILYRWPVQLELLDEKLAPQIMAPGDYAAPANLDYCFDQGWNLDKVSKVLHRPYTRYQYYLEPDQAMVAAELQRQFGWDEPDVNGYAEDWITREYDAATAFEVEQIVADDMGAA